MTFLLLPSVKFLLQGEKYQTEMDSALLKKEWRKDIGDFTSPQTEELSKTKCSLCFNEFLVQSADKIQLNQLWIAEEGSFWKQILRKGLV